MLAVYLYIEIRASEILLIIMRIACNSPTLPRLNCLYNTLTTKLSLTPSNLTCYTCDTSEGTARGIITENILYRYRVTTTEIRYTGSPSQTVEIQGCTPSQRLELQGHHHGDQRYRDTTTEKRGRVQTGHSSNQVSTIQCQ